MNPSFTGQRSMMLHSKASRNPVRTGGAPELVETRTRRAAGELGVLGEGDRTLHTVGLHGAERVLALRTHVAEGDVELVRRGFG